MDVVWSVVALLNLGMLSVVLYLLRKQRLAFEREVKRRERVMSALLEDPMDPHEDGAILVAQAEQEHQDDDESKTVG